MYYFFCNEYFINGVKFEATASLANGSEKVVIPDCSENTEKPSNITVLKGNCTYDGNWDVEDNVTSMCAKNHILDRHTGKCSCK